MLAVIAVTMLSVSDSSAQSNRVNPTADYALINGSIYPDDISEVEVLYTIMNGNLTYDHGAR